MSISYNDLEETTHSSQYLQLGFSLMKKSRLKQKFDIFLQIGYNNRHEKLFGLDAYGVVTFSTGNFALLRKFLVREFHFPKYETNCLLFLTYCEKYGVYFGVNKNFRIQILNEYFKTEFETLDDSCLHPVGHVQFNSITDELITHGVLGTSLWKLQVKNEQPIGALATYSHYSLYLKAQYSILSRSECECIFLLEASQKLLYCSKGTILVYSCKNMSLLYSWLAHGLPITCITFSSSEQVLISASLDNSIKIWSETGSHISTFTGHTHPVKSLSLCAAHNTLLFSASVDGVIKVWSLKTLEEFYTTFTCLNGVFFMGTFSNGVVWCGSKKEIHLYKFQTCNTDMWAYSNCKIVRFFGSEAVNKNKLIVTIGEDSSARIYQPTIESSTSVCVMLTPPLVVAGVMCIAYNRLENLFYLLVTPRKIWIYTSKTNPACKIAEWSINDLQTFGYYRSTWDDRYNNQMSVAIDQAGLWNESKMLSTATCLSTCYSSEGFRFSHSFGVCSALKRNMLLVGLRDGSLLFADCKKQNQIYFVLKAARRALLDVQHNYKKKMLITISDYELFTFKTWSLPTLQLQHQLAFGNNFSVYEVFGGYVAIGYKDGVVNLYELQTPSPLRRELEEGFRDDDVHSAAVISISSCLPKKVFCTVSTDQLIKIWGLQGKLLSEIKLDESLSSCYFLNATGDLLIGWKSHIFKISSSKLMTSSSDDSDDESTTPSSVGDLSTIYEDPNVVGADAILESNDVTLESYLKPFPLVVDGLDVDIRQLKRSKKISLVQRRFLEKKKSKEDVEIVIGVHRSEDFFNDKFMSLKLLDEDSLRFDHKMEEIPEEDDKNERLKVGKSLVSRMSFINKYVDDVRVVSLHSLHEPIPSDKTQLLHNLKKELSTRSYNNYEFLRTSNQDIFKQSQTRGIELPIVSSRSPQKIKIEQISNIPLKNRLQTRLTKSAAFYRQNNLSKQKKSEKKLSNNRNILKSSQQNRSFKTDSDESIDKDVRSISEVRMIYKSKSDEKKSETNRKTGFEMIKYDEDWYKSKIEKLEKFHEQRFEEQKQIERFKNSLVKDVLPVSSLKPPKEINVLERSPSFHKTSFNRSFTSKFNHSQQQRPTSNQSHAFKLNHVISSVSKRPITSQASRRTTPTRHVQKKDPCQFHRPRSSCSIPNKMSYVLIQPKTRKSQRITPTKLEEDLLRTRFPIRYQQMLKEEFSVASSQMMHKRHFLYRHDYTN